MGTVFGLFYQFLAGRGTGLTLHGSSVENSVLPKTSYEQLILPGKSRFFRFDSALIPLWVRFGSALGPRNPGRQSGGIGVSMWRHRGGKVGIRVHQGMMSWISRSPGKVLVMELCQHGLGEYCITCSFRNDRKAL